MKKTQIIPSRLNSCKIYSIAQNKLKKIYNTNSGKRKGKAEKYTSPQQINNKMNQTPTLKVTFERLKNSP